MQFYVGPGVQTEITDRSLLFDPWTDVLEYLPDAVFMVDGAGIGGKIKYLNPQASRMFGYQHGDLIDHSIELLVPVQPRERHVQHRPDYSLPAQLRPMGAGLQLLGRRRDGTEFPIDVMLNHIGDRTPPVTVAVVRDMTEHKQLEEALGLARDSAVRANEVKSRFLAAASHDLRQPLQTIWSLQSVLGRALKGTEFVSQLGLLEESVRSMDEILSSLIDINRLEKGAIQPVVRDFPLREILARLRSELGYAAACKSLILDVEDSPEFVRSDPMLLPVILRNLIGNAIKYTLRGTVRLRVRPTESRIEIDICDSGVGIPPENLQRIFEAFYQTDNPNRDQRQGVGLGLSIVQTLCRLLDHAITIESRVGVGSTFTVQLPRGTATALPAERVSLDTLAAPTSSGSKVLHIEDDPGVARSMEMLLRLEGYDVVGAASRDEALQRVTVDGLRPDLILCDYQLPLGITGDEIVTEIAALLHAKPPTIMLTGDIADRHVAQARKIADRILPKPVDINLLLREIETLLANETAPNCPLSPCDNDLEASEGT
ncbi:MAG: hybrid sensor histidine kinase/response regulator [Steroidobacteraceae bacterium]